MDGPEIAVPLRVIVREWARIGLIGFGGPPAHIALLRGLCVEDREWIAASEFEDAIAACNLLPGPASTQLAIWCGWRLRGARGALLAGVCFIVPGLVVIIGLAAVFLAARPPTVALGAANGADSAVAAVALQAAYGLAPASWRRIQQGGGSTPGDGAAKPARGTRRARTAQGGRGDEPDLTDQGGPGSAAQADATAPDGTAPQGSAAQDSARRDSAAQDSAGRRGIGWEAAVSASGGQAGAGQRDARWDSSAQASAGQAGVEQRDARWGSSGPDSAGPSSAAPSSAAQASAAPSSAGQASARQARGAWVGRGRWVGYAVAGGAAAATIGPLLVLVLLGCGLAEVVVRTRPAGAGRAVLPFALPATAAAGGLGAVAWTAFKVGALSYGGGFVIIPLMQHDAVDTYHWLTASRFLDAVALGQVTPGPVVQTVAVVGYAAAGVGGALLAALIAFTPSFAFILGGARRFDRLRGNGPTQAFLTGAGPATIGAIAGSAIPLALALDHGWQYALLAAAACWLLLLRRGVVSAFLLTAACGVAITLA